MRSMVEGQAATRTTVQGLASGACPSTTALRPAVPLPVPGRIAARPPHPRRHLGPQARPRPRPARFHARSARPSLDAAHARLDHGLTLALAQGARLVLLITGRPRPGDHAGRGERRGAIRAKFLDWLAAGPHAARIAAIRPAHPRHGGAGAVYLVLRRRAELACGLRCCYCDPFALD